MINLIFMLIYTKLFGLLLTAIRSMHISSYLHFLHKQEANSRYGSSIPVVEFLLFISIISIKYALSFAHITCS